MAAGTTTITVGWREWATLPTLGIPAVKAKVDTGARTSALHAVDVVIDREDADHPIVRFVVLPHQRSDDDPVQASAPLLDERHVRSSSGAMELRPVIRTTLRLANVAVDAELTLTNRDEMGFRMLIGREALRPTFVVDPGRSWLGGHRSSL